MKVDNYEDFTSDFQAFDALRAEASWRLKDDFLGPQFRRHNQGTLVYDAWDPDSVGVERGVFLTKQNALNMGMIFKVTEVVVDPHMVFVLGEVFV